MAKNRFFNNYSHCSKPKRTKHTKGTHSPQKPQLGLPGLTEEQLLRSAAKKILAHALANPCDQAIQQQYLTFVLSVLDWCDRTGTTPNWVHELVGSNKHLANSSR